MELLFSLDYSLITETLFQILSVIGFWKLFVKCGEKGFWSLIPGFRYYKLGEIAGKESEGTMCILLGILTSGAGIMHKFLDESSRADYIVSIIGLTATLILIIYQIRITNALCRLFKRSRGWIAVWVVAEWLAALIWGFNSKFQPDAEGPEDDGEILGGVVPAGAGFNILSPAGSAAAEEAEVSGTAGESGILVPKTGVIRKDGLVVRLRQRTVRSYLKKRYLLKDISLFIPDKSLVLLLGGSGAGKSTFVNAITGYEPADARILLHGTDVYKNYDNMKYQIGFVPQTDLLRMNDTVKKTLADAAQLRLPKNMSRKEKKERIQNVMDTLGLTAGQNALVSKKSGGQKKRISIGMELIASPSLFILDEPDSGLDGVIARELFEKLRTVADEGSIVIAITHTPDRVVHLFDKVIVLARDSGRVGRLAFYGSPDEARVFFGRSSMEEIVMAVNSSSEGGEGRADEYIAKFEALRAERGEA